MHAPVSVNIKLTSAFKPAKYDYFTAKYPNISLELIHFENVLDVNLTDI